jgi:sulfatase maturation enzyme AslB (radical SAM superfamily)
MGIEDVLIREEFFGHLIYSNKNKSYYIPKTSITKEIIKYIKENSQVDITKLINSQEEILKKELINLGFNGIIHLSEIERRIGPFLSAPLDIYFDYTSKCNLRCPKCYDLDKKSELSHEDIINI